MKKKLLTLAEEMLRLNLNQLSDLPESAEQAFVWSHFEQDPSQDDDYASRATMQSTKLFFILLLAESI